MLRSQPRPPREFVHLIGVLGMFAAPIDWAQFESWTRMTRRAFARWELDVIAHIDLKRQQ